MQMKPWASNNEGNVDTWTQILEDEESSNVEFRVLEGSGSEVVIRAHSLVLLLCFGKCILASHVTEKGEEQPLEDRRTHLGAFLSLAHPTTRVRTITHWFHALSRKDFQLRDMYHGSTKRAESGKISCKANV